MWRKIMCERAVHTFQGMQEDGRGGRVIFASVRASTIAGLAAAAAAARGLTMPFEPPSVFEHWYSPDAVYAHVGISYALVLPFIAYVHSNERSEEDAGSAAPAAGHSGQSG